MIHIRQRVQSSSSGDAPSRQSVTADFSSFTDFMSTMADSEVSWTEGRRSVVWRHIVVVSQCLPCRPYQQAVADAVDVVEKLSRLRRPGRQIVRTRQPQQHDNSLLQPLCQSPLLYVITNSYNNDIINKDELILVYEYTMDQEL